MFIYVKPELSTSVFDSRCRLQLMLTVDYLRSSENFRIRDNGMEETLLNGIDMGRNMHNDSEPLGDDEELLLQQVVVVVAELVTTSGPTYQCTHTAILQWGWFHIFRLSC